MDSVMIWWSELKLLAAHGKSRHSVAPTGVSRLEIMHHRPSTSGRRWCFLQSVAPLIGTSRDRHPMRFFGLQEMPSVSFSVLQRPLKTRNQQKGSAQSSPQQHTGAKQFILDAGDDTVHTLVCFSECMWMLFGAPSGPQFCGPSPLPQLFIVFHTSSWLQAAALHQASQLPGDHKDHGDCGPQRQRHSGACWVFVGSVWPSRSDFKRPMSILGSSGFSQSNLRHWGMPMACWGSWKWQHKQMERQSQISVTFCNYACMCACADIQHIHYIYIYIYIYIYVCAYIVCVRAWKYMEI